MSAYYGHPLQDIKKRRFLAAFMSVAALAAVGGGFALQERKTAEEAPEVVHLDPWSQCIKDAADQAMRSGGDFEHLAQSCSKLASRERQPA